MRSRNKARHIFSDLVLATRSDAEEVLSTLVEYVDMYELVTVADFYDAVGVASDYTDTKYGWDDLREAYIRPVRGGYIIEFPRTILID